MFEVESELELARRGYMSLYPSLLYLLSTKVFFKMYFLK